jgi:glucose-1-phosphate cytidylyltransferase
MSAASPSTVVILCGGRGTRLQETTTAIPKPLVEIGGRPILWHVMEIYACQGFRRFILCLGYKGELIEEFVRRADWPRGTEVVCAPTGVDTQTGGRIKRVAEHLPDETFCTTYADGVADIDLGRSEDLINGGFFCFEPEVLDYLGDNSVLERQPLERLVADGELVAFRHEGFWDCLDTYKDALMLNDLWAAGEAPWKVWEPSVR